MNNEIDTEIWIEDFITDFIELTGLDLSIEEISLSDDDVLTVGLGGPDSARAIGRDGQVLEALQHIIVAASVHARVPHRRIMVDIEHYRERREQRLLDEAADVAYEVLDTGKPLDFEPMTPRERRLVHMVVADIEGVTTQSRGIGEERYVRVLPQD